MTTTINHNSLMDTRARVIISEASTPARLVSLAQARPLDVPLVESTDGAPLAPAVAGRDLAEAMARIARADMTIESYSWVRADALVFIADSKAWSTDYESAGAFYEAMHITKSSVSEYRRAIAFIKKAGLLVRTEESDPAEVLGMSAPAWSVSTQYTRVHVNNAVQLARLGDTYPAFLKEYGDGILTMPIKALKGFIKAFKAGEPSTPAEGETSTPAESNEYERILNEARGLTPAERYSLVIDILAGINSMTDSEGVALAEAVRARRANISKG